MDGKCTCLYDFLGEGRTSSSLDKGSRNGYMSRRNSLLSEEDKSDYSQFSF